MRPFPEALEITCPMCGEELVVELVDEGSQPARCGRCGYRLDADSELREHGFGELLPDDGDRPGG